MFEGVPSDLQPDVPHAHTRGPQALHVHRLRQRILSEFRPQEARPQTPRRYTNTAISTTSHLAHQESPISAQGAPTTARRRTGPVRVRPWSVLSPSRGVRPGGWTLRALGCGWWTADGARGAAWNATEVCVSGCRSAAEQPRNGVSCRTTTLSSHLVVNWITKLLLLATTTTVMMTMMMTLSPAVTTVYWAVHFSHSSHTIALRQTSYHVLSSGQISLQTIFVPGTD